MEGTGVGSARCLCAGQHSVSALLYAAAWEQKLQHVFWSSIIPHEPRCQLRRSKFSSRTPHLQSWSHNASAARLACVLRHCILHTHPLYSKLMPAVTAGTSSCL